MSTLVPTWNGTQSKILWVAIAALGAAALASSPPRQRREQSMPLWIVVAAVSVYVSPTGYYALFIAETACCRLDSERARHRPTAHNDGLDYVPHQHAMCCSAPIRGDRRRRPARRPRAGARRRWATCRASSGSSRAWSLPARCRTSSSCSSPMRRDGRSLGELIRAELGIDPRASSPCSAHS